MILRLFTILGVSLRKVTSEYLKYHNEYVCFQPGIRKIIFQAKKSLLSQKVTFSPKSWNFRKMLSKISNLVTFHDPCPVPPRDDRGTLHFVAFWAEISVSGDVAGARD